MNSLQKQVQEEEKSSHQSFVKSFQQMLTQMESVSEVETLYKKLQFLGLHLDPFKDEVPAECVQIMDSLELTDHLKNPYLATNIILSLLDKTEERLNKLKQ
jgi:hypothetical protein